MNRFMVYSLLFIGFVLSGCVIRTGTTQVDRVDQEITGNRGFIMGTVPEVEETGEKKTRTIYNVEIELPYPPESSVIKSGSKDEDKELSGNRGYVEGEMTSDEEVGISNNPSGVTRLGGFKGYETPKVVYSTPVQGTEQGETLNKEEMKSYIVKEGDTLQKISDKIFGTTKKWNNIYEANKDVLKSPDRIRPGQKLVIPQE